MNIKFHDLILETEIGRGSYGIVYRAIHRRTKNIYVIKKVPLSPPSNHKLKDAINEVEILKSLTHPNIIQYLGYHIENHALSIITEYAEGGDLFKLVQQ